MRNRARTVVLVACGAILISAPPAARSEEKSPPQFIGAKACGGCHKSKATGNQYEVWQASAHARAFETLASKQSIEIAAKLGMKEEPQQAARCLACHRTGAGQLKARFDLDFDVTQGVQCETCHGMGSIYAKIDHMILPSKAHAAGLIEPTPALCRKCHNAESPTFKGFDYAAAVKKIAHPLAPK